MPSFLRSSTCFGLFQSEREDTAFFLNYSNSVTERHLSSSHGLQAQTSSSSSSSISYIVKFSPTAYFKIIADVDGFSCFLHFTALSVNVALCAE